MLLRKWRVPNAPVDVMENSNDGVTTGITVKTDGPTVMESRLKVLNVH